MNASSHNFDSCYTHTTIYTEHESIICASLSLDSWLERTIEKAIYGCSHCHFRDSHFDSALDSEFLTTPFPIACLLTGLFFSPLQFSSISLSPSFYFHPCSIYPYLVENPLEDPLDHAFDCVECPSSNFICNSAYLHRRGTVANKLESFAIVEWH